MREQPQGGSQGVEPNVEIDAGRARDVLLFVPVHLASRFRGHRLALRADDPRSFPECLKGDDLERIEYLQLTDLEADPAPLLRWERVFPIDLVMRAPGRELPRLYVHAPLLDRGPVRVSIPAADGMERAVKLAASLRLSVKIIPEQPNVDEVQQLIRLADFYLRNPTIEAPIEFFHSLFFAFVKEEAATLWDILEKDPARYLFVKDDGRPSERQPKEREGEGSHSACPACPYCPWCCGFFKYPAPDYSCEMVLCLFQHLFASAEEFRRDLAAASGSPP